MLSSSKMTDEIDLSFHVFHLEGYKKHIHLKENKSNNIV